MEVGQGPNWGCSAKEKQIKSDYVTSLKKFEVQKYAIQVQYMFRPLLGNLS
jgi:hypothetical protein